MYQNPESDLKHTNEIRFSTDLIKKIQQKFSTELEAKRIALVKACASLFITESESVEEAELLPGEKQDSNETNGLLLTRIEEFVDKVRNVQKQILFDNGWINMDMDNIFERINKDQEMINNWIVQLANGYEIESLMFNFQVDVEKEILSLLGRQSLSYERLNQAQQLLVEIAYIKDQAKECSPSEWWNKQQKTNKSTYLFNNSFDLLSNFQKFLIKEASYEIRDKIGLKSLKEFWNLLEQEKNNSSDYNTAIELLRSEYEKLSQASQPDELVKMTQELRM